MSISAASSQDTGKRKTFVNTTLGETWEAKIGERPDAEVMAERKEHYSAPVPDRVASCSISSSKAASSS
ncbi:terminase gpA endonuclease subunit [Escherichia coli]|uniref:terminase gpA endonuclease subunit n=1 Tax=Escherichia coli TaxID=562 RepID=UPI003EC02C84